MDASLMAGSASSSRACRPSPSSPSGSCASGACASGRAAHGPSRSGYATGLKLVRISDLAERPHHRPAHGGPHREPPLLPGRRPHRLHPDRSGRHRAVGRRGDYRLGAAARHCAAQPGGRRSLRPQQHTDLERRKVEAVRGWERRHDMPAVCSLTFIPVSY